MRPDRVILVFNADSGLGAMLLDVRTSWPGGAPLAASLLCYLRGPAGIIVAVAQQLS